MERTVQTFKKQHIDLLFLCAGVGLMQPFEQAQSLDNYRHIMDVDFYGAIYCTHYALPYLKNAHGHVCVISSLQGKFAVPNRTGYAASKHALHGFYNCLRIELQGRVDVTLVCPGVSCARTLFFDLFFSMLRILARTLSLP